MVEAHHGIYVEYHHRIVEAVEQVIHVKSVNSIDEMVCDLTGSARNREKAVAIAHDVKRSIKEHVEARCCAALASLQTTISQRQQRTCRSRTVLL
ncbi:MAG: hypothetical protein IPF79_00015 [Ignavibacteria bacterium]|nr:hypothetical protein [Ignavibacteria bacterium]